MTFREFISKNIVEVTFVKKNGEIRNMLCTLLPMFLPETGNGVRELPKNLLTVFDLEKNDWRTINLNTLKGIKIVEE